MALWGLSVADRPLEAEGKTVVMRFICVAGREMVNAGRETSMAKHDFSISGFETIANAVAAENCRHGVHFMPCARATGRDWQRVWLTAEDQAMTAEDQTLYCGRPSADCGRPSAGCGKPSADCERPSVDCGRPSAVQRQRAAQCGSHDIGHKDFGVLLSVLINYL